MHQATQNTIVNYATQNTIANNVSQVLADDLLRGADAIAEFIFGSRGSRRKVYYLSESSHLPVFRLGSVLCARRSVLLRWIAGQESRVQPPPVSEI
jgi:hypothetical protein